MGDLLDFLPGGIAVVDSAPSVVRLNAAAAAIPGASELREPLRRTCREVIDASVACNCEYVAPDGRVFAVTITPAPAPEFGAVLYFAGGSDRSSDHLRLIQSVTGVGTWEQSLITGELIWSREMYAILGLSPADGTPVLQTWRDRIHPDDLARTDREFQEVLLSGDVLDTEMRIVRPNGEVRWVLAKARIVRSVLGEPVRAVGLTLDITERKLVTEALREIEERYRLAAQAGRIGLWEWQIATDRVIWSDRVYEFHGLQPGQFGGAAGDFAQLVHPDDRDMVLRALEETLRDDAPYELEFRTLRPTGEVRWLATSARVIRDAEGNPVRLLGASQDVTERRRAEEALRRSHAELEQFALVASHDLQEPLRAVKIYSQLLVRRLARPDDLESQRFSEFIAGGVDRMEALIRDLLSWSRTVHDDSVPEESVDLSICFSEALRALEAGMIESAAVVRCSALPTVQGDSTQMQQLFQNLLSNSLKYKRPEVTPEICVEARRDGGEWVIEVSDNGIGFDPQYASRIFGLFKRLHRNEYPGSGLGLAICKRIVERHRGRIWATAECGRGARFFVALPASQANLI